ncbi:MAG TPA: hypothetical protein VHW69_01160 [Rhizomicrobium sp.]|nr:hypothetical protein [Rhizomicrobium sp.]
MKISAVTAASMLVLCCSANADVSISNKPTQNMSCSAGVCMPTAPKAVLNVDDLTTMLASGDVTVKTGTLAKDIDIDQPLTWSSTSRLTLDAQQSVTVKKQITVAGTGALTVVANDTGGAKAKNKAGEFIIVPEHGSVQFLDLSSSLMIDGNAYTLVGDIKTLASDIATNPSGFYALAKSYDASVDGAYSAAPITTLFQGVLEGLGNEIVSLSIRSGGGGALIGLFPAIDSPAIIRHLGIVKANLSASASHGIGLLVGGDSFGLIERCWTNGSISLSNSLAAGGLTSGNEGTITNSYAQVRVQGYDPWKTLGGLVGFNDGLISSSYAIRSVALRNGTLVYVGGLVGENTGIIVDSYARNHIADGKNNDTSRYGGLVGENAPGAQIETSYAAGPITSHSQGVHIGGFIGEDEAAPGSIHDSYWDLDMGVSDPSRGAGNVENDPGIAGLSDTQPKSGLPDGFDPKIWGQSPSINSGYPYLLANPPK